MTSEGNVFVSILLSVISAVLAENFVFARAFGVGTMITSAKNKRYLPGICLGVCYFSTAGSAAAKLLSDAGVLEVERHYRPLVYIAVIGILYAVTLVAALLIFRNSFSKIKKYVHISAFNTVVMGTIFLSITGSGSLIFPFFGICAGLGFTAASYMLSGVYGQLYSENVPAAFRGYPAVMIFTGIIAMAVYGILGRVPLYI